MSDTHANGDPARRSILKALLELQGDNGGVSDERIAAHLSLDVEEVRGHLDILSQRGAVSLTKTRGGYGAWLKPGQKQAAKELLAGPAQPQPSSSTDNAEVVEPSAPTVFISYSHDSTDHKMWVAGLATALRKNGVDATLDQWALRPGMDVPNFMESGIRTANRVCIVCTPEYARKADAGRGGAGYEKLIVTGELYSDLGSTKFIPVIASGQGDEPLLSFLKGRYYVDFRNAAEYDKSLEELLRDLHDMPATVPPPIGQNPFLSVQAASPATGPTPVSSGTTPVELPDDPSVSSEQVYDTCEELLRRGDVVGLKQLSKRLRALTSSRLVAWLERLRGKSFPKPEDFVPEARSVVSDVMPLMVMALANVESTLPTFADQRSVVDDLLSLPNWPKGGSRLISEMPRSLVYVYQYLYGAVCLFTRQLQPAIALATMGVRTEQGAEYKPLWEQKHMTGWPLSLGGLPAWEYLWHLPQTHPVLQKVFTRDGDWTCALTGHNLLLCLLDFASTIAWVEKERKTLAEVKGRFELVIPPHFYLCDEEVRDRAFAMAVRDSTATELIASSTGATVAGLRRNWKQWLGIVVQPFAQHYHVFHATPIPDLP